MYILVLDAELYGKLFSSNVLPTEVKVSNSGPCPFTAALTILDFIYVVSTCTVTYTFRQVSQACELMWLVWPSEKLLQIYLNEFGNKKSIRFNAIKFQDTDH